MVVLYHLAVCPRHHAVIPQVVLQVEMVRAVCDVTSLRQDSLQCPILIDHITTIVRSGGYAVYHMLRARLRSVRRIRVFNVTVITKLYSIGRI